MASFVPPTALLDANVLYPAALRDLFLWLAVVGIYRPRWSETSHDEWMRNVLANRPDLTRSQLERTRTLMDRVDPSCVVTGHEQLIPTLHLPNANDRHVLAAAIQANASVLVTFNLSDFPASALAPYSLTAQRPDVFLNTLLDAQPQIFLDGVARNRASLHKPAKSVDDYLAALHQNGLTELVRRLDSYRNFL